LSLQWSGSNDKQWSCIHSFQENGDRSFVVRENPRSPLLLASLTDRELQIVLHAARGLTNSEIALELGIAGATVRVLIARAAARIGVHTRRELLAHPAIEPVRLGAAVRKSKRMNGKSR